MKNCCKVYIISLMKEFKKTMESADFYIIATCVCGSKINIKIEEPRK